MRIKTTVTTTGALASVLLLTALVPAFADGTGSPPGSSGAAIAASQPFAVNAPGMQVGTQEFPDGAGPIVEFPAFPTVGGFSCETAIANNGDLITDEFLGNAMGRVDPHTGQVSEIPLPNIAGLPGGQNRGPDGDIWFAEVGGSGLGRLDTETEQITTYPFPWGSVTLESNLPLLEELYLGPGVPFDNTWGKDGKLYFTAIGLNSIGSFDPETEEWERFPIPTPAAGPVAMEEGPDETIAITEGMANKVALFDIDTETWQEFPIPTPGITFPAGLTVSPDEKYLYFGETFASKVGRLDPETGIIKEYNLALLRPGGILGGTLNGNPLPQPGQMRFGSDGKLYIVSGTFTGGGTLGQLDPATSKYYEINTPSPIAMPCDLNNTVPGKLIFSSFASNRVAYMEIPNTVDVSNTYPRFG